MPNAAGITAEDLDAGWKRALRKAYESEIPDILRWEDHKLRWETERDEILTELDGGTYEPSAPIVVEVPKDGFSTRPIAVLRPRDHAVYEAVVGKIASNLDGQLGEDVFSARIRPAAHGYRMPKQTKAWAAFQRAAREAYEEHSLAFMLTTDVASYFEYVDLKTLTRDIRSVDEVEEELVALLSKILNTFERTSDIWGLPQGVDASSLLGNFYLLPVDQALSRLEVRSLRFQDDFKIFAESEVTLRKALRDVIRVMRNRHLNISVRKTKLLTGEEILDEIEDARKDAIQYGLETGDPSAPEAVRALFDEAVVSDPVNARDVRFSVFRLSQIEDDHAVRWILENLQSVPYLASILVEYLSQHSGAHPEIVPDVGRFLGDRDRNLYPYVEMELLRMLARADSLDSATKRIVWAIASDGNREVYVREYAMRCIGRHASAGDEGNLRTMFGSTGDVRLKRAIVVAISEAFGIDNSWLAGLERAEPSIAHTCAYLRRGGQIPEP